MASKQIQQGSTPAHSQPQQQGTPMPQPQSGKPVYTDWASI